MTQAIIPHTDHDLAEQSIFDKAVAIVLDTLSPTSRRGHRTYVLGHQAIELSALM